MKCNLRPMPVFTGIALGSVSPGHKFHKTPDVPNSAVKSLNAARGITNGPNELNKTDEVVLAQQALSILIIGKIQAGFCSTDELPFFALLMDSNNIDVESVIFALLGPKLSV